MGENPLQDSAQNLVIKQLPPTGERLPLFIVGDVHGCALELDRLIKEAKKKTPKFQLVLVGDLFTKGPDPVGVYDIIRQTGAICVKGNHDWALMASLLQQRRRGVDNLPKHTQQTLKLIRYHRKAIFHFLTTLPHAIVSEVKPLVNRPGWEQQFPLFVVHAAIDPTVGLEKTPERMLLTARYVRWDKESDGQQKLILVPSPYRLEVLGELGGFHKVPKEDRFRWHDLHKGPELIVFGHDAKQGLFRKTNKLGRPVCVGIDTGCTYGRTLTGYFPEFDDAIQVHAARNYFDIHRNIILVKSSSQDSENAAQGGDGRLSS